jgi:hypothetical protein
LTWDRRNKADRRQFTRIVFSMRTFSAGAFGAGLLCALAQPTAAMAEQIESFTCTQGDQVRKVERVFEPGGAPCSVRYYRNKQPPQSVWRAKESGSVCVDGARKMIQEFRAAGYTCTGAPSDAAASEPAPSGPAPEPVPEPSPRSGRTGPAEPATGAGGSRSAQSLCYALTYEACGPGGRNCDMKPASICAQPDNRWQMTDGMRGDLDPLTRFLPGEPGKCYRVYRDGQPRPLCTEAAGSPNTVWSLR